MQQWYHSLLAGPWFCIPKQKETRTCLLLDSQQQRRCVTFRDRKKKRTKLKCSRSRTELNTAHHVFQKTHCRVVLIPLIKYEWEEEKSESVKQYAEYNRASRFLCLILPPSLLTHRLPRKAADRICHFTAVLCCTQPATGSVPPWPLAALQPSRVSLLFLKYYIEIAAERIHLRRIRNPTDVTPAGCFGSSGSPIRISGSSNALQVKSDGLKLFIWLINLFFFNVNKFRVAVWDVNTFWFHLFGTHRRMMLRQGVVSTFALKK